MLRKFHRLLLLVILAVLSVGTAFGQAALGNQKFGSFGGGSFDKVNLGNLNAHFGIPVLHKPGRGLPFNFDLTYDTTFWQPVTSGSSTFWNPITTGGWSGSALNVGALGYSYATDGVSYIYYCNLTYYDGFGTAHPFPGCAQYVYPNDYLYQQTAIDSSGYTLYLDPYHGTYNLTSADGNQIYPNPVGPQVKPGSVVDRNGNEITGANGAYIDTLGTTALTTAGGCTSPGNCTPYTLTYTSPANTAAAVTLTFKNYTIKTNFGCSGVSEYGPQTGSLVDRVTLPDGTYYQFTYEATPGFSGDVTGRLASVKLPTGGTITYGYTGAHNGIVCADGTSAGLSRTTPDGTWTYARTQGTGSAWTTTVTDPQGNQSVINFQKDSSSNSTYSFYETQRQIYQGSSSSGTLLMTTQACYNNNANGCPNPTAVASPITKTDYYTNPPGLSGSISETTFNSYGLPTDHKDFDWGNALKRERVYTYPTNLANIPAFWQTVTTKDGSGNVIAQTTNNFGDIVVSTSSPQHVSVGSSHRGNLTSVVQMTQGSSTLTKTYTYFDTGEVQTATDVNGAQTTYTYGACGNSFPTNVAGPYFSTSATWNCTGGVQTSATDANGNTNYTNYTTDPYFWRPESTKDAAGNVTTYTYTSQTQAESVLSFNSGASAVDTLTTLDSQGRKLLTQTRQAPGSANFDSVEMFYDTLGRQIGNSLPYTGTAGQTTTAGASPKTIFDAYSRPTQVTDSGGANTTYAYTGNLVLVTSGPAPTGENTKRKQIAIDGLGRITDVCEITSAAGSGTCAQGVAQTGYWTKYTYDALDDITRVTQNAQLSSTQTRTYAYDGLGRLTSETNPESGTKTYTYDSIPVSPCNNVAQTFNGDLVRTVDANGTYTCYFYDALHRLTDVGTNRAQDGCKRFRYDNSNGVLGAKPSGVTTTNSLGQLVEAETDNCTWPITAASVITDEWSSYSPRGELTDAWESTPHSGAYYHPTAAYWANGGLKNLWISTLPSISYGADGEGRPSSVSASSGQNPVTGTTYNGFSQVTGVTFGSGDSDSFAYDPNTGRMTQYKYSVNGSSEIGNLTWNANGSLKSLAITDPFNSGDAQTCNYAHDDLSRISSANCGSPWSQTFSYDAFGNITKSGSISWQPGYSSSTNHYTLGGTTYDSDGNLLNDSFHTYTWNVFGRPLTIDSTGLTYDAFDRMVEQNQAGTYYQIVYDPTGEKLGVFKGSTIQQLYVPLPGGAAAEYLSWGLSHYRHPDWLGSLRLDASTSHSILGNNAYAPFGEPYAQTGNGEVSFTGANKDTVWLQYDFMLRQYDPKQGRWITPDPAGMGAVDPSDPQTWNRYAYVRNSPLNTVDPLGLDGCDDFGCDGGGWDGGWGGWDGNFGESLGIPTAINVIGSGGGGFNQCDFFACGTGSASNDFLSGVSGSGTLNDPWTYNVQVWWRFLPDPQGNGSWAWDFTKAFFGGFTVFGPKNDPRPSCFGTFLSESAKNFVGAGNYPAPNADTIGGVAATHYAASQLLNTSVVPGSKALRGGLSVKQWVAKDQAGQLARSGGVAILANADLAMAEALDDELGTALAGGCK